MESYDAQKQNFKIEREILEDLTKAQLQREFSVNTPIIIASDNQQNTVMTKASGIGLDDLISMGKRFKVEEIINLSKDICNIFICLHQDLKASLLEGDFHIGDIFWDKRTRRAYLIDFNEVQPEEDKGKKFNPNSDITALGNHLYYAVTGERFDNKHDPRTQDQKIALLPSELQQPIKKAILGEYGNDIAQFKIDLDSLAIEAEL